MIAELSERFKGVKLAQIGMLSLVLLSIVSFNQVVARNVDWKDNKSLYFADLPKVPESVRALAFCGITIASELEGVSDSLMRNQSAREAIAYFERAYKIYPDYANMYQDWGAAYARINNIDSAIWAWNRLKVLNPNSINSKANDDYIRRNNYLKAIAKYNEALPLKDFKKLLYYQREAMVYDSTVTDGWLLLGKLYYVNGVNDSARWAINKYLLMKPDDKAAKDLLISIP
jgi:tetratricopeptide (TPR) repeat protein